MGLALGRAEDAPRTTHPDAGACHSRQPSQTSPKERPRSTRTRSRRTDAIVSASPSLFEQLALIASARDLPRQRLRLGAALGIELAKLGHGLLDDLAVAANRTNEAPVDVLLAVLPNRRVSEIHDRTPPSPNLSGPSAPWQGGKLALTRASPTRSTQSRILSRARDPEIAQLSSELRKLG